MANQRTVESPAALSEGRRGRRSGIWRGGIGRGAVFAALLGVLGAVAPGVARAGDDAPQGRDALAARLLEAAETRMKAKLEEARLLEALGRRDEALAALKAIEPIHERALAQVKELTTPLAPAFRIAVAPPRPANPSSRERPPFTEGWVRQPSYPKAWPHEDAPQILAPRVDPEPGAVAFLLRCQTEDGLFHVAAGRAAADPETTPTQDVRGTALALLAILDAAPADLPQDLAVTLGRSLRRAGDALAARAVASGALDPDLETHAVALWALAAAYGRLGVDEWKPALAAAVGHALAQRDANGTWTPPSGTSATGPVPAGAAAAIRTTVTMMTALHECLPLTVAVPRTAEIQAALAQAADSKSVVPPPGDAEAETAFRLIHLATTLREIGAAPRPDWLFDAAHRGPNAAQGTRNEPLAPWGLLFGTVLVRAEWGGTEAPAYVAFWNDHLVPSMNLQQSGPSPVEGSWGGSEAVGSMSRLETTALHLLAWTATDAVWQDPAAR